MLGLWIKKKLNWRAALLLSALFLVLPYPATAANIEDKADELHINAIGDLFTDGKDKLLCVKTEAGKYVLWNLSDNTMSPAINGVCRPSDKLHALNPLITFDPNNETIDSNSIKNFNDDARIVFVSDGSTNNCGSSLRTYFRVIHTNGSQEPFYLVTRLKNPQDYRVEAWCDGADGKAQAVSQIFDTVMNLSSVDLGNGLTLLYSYDSRSTRPIAFTIHSIPDSVIAINSDLFLVPASLMHSQLIAEDNLAAKYAILLKTLKSGANK